MSEDIKKRKAERRKKRIILRIAIIFVMIASIAALCVVAHKASKKVEISLNGQESVSIPWKGEYIEEGAGAVSYYTLFGKNEKELKVDISGTVDPGHAGDYVITYTAADGKDKAKARRTVTVLPMSEEQKSALVAICDAFTKKTVEELPEDEKIIFLTFDDGPGAYTERLLDLLDQYGIKATFFVTENFPDYEYLISEEYKRGHAIGVHTKTHKPELVYVSEEAFWNDVEAMNDIIEKQTGQRTHLLRFLGGGSNTISKNYSPGIMTRLTESMEDHGYTYFDWNVSSGDSDGTKTKEGCYANIVNELPDHRISIILCHDIKEYLIDTMEDFIPWALDNGYTFLPLYEGAPTAHHKVFN